MKPNPSLHAIDQAPFYAVKIVPGDLGTKGGLVTDEHARVLRPDGSAIPGLYAAGNTSAAIMGRTYAGPGATIGPAMTFGYLAALDLASSEVEPVETPDERGRPHAHRPDQGVGAELPDRSFSWTESDVLLYHLGIGFGARAGDNVDAATLRYTSTAPGAAGAAVVRHRGADLPRHRPAVVRACPASTSTWARSSTAARRSRCTAPCRPSAAASCTPGSATCGTRARRRSSCRRAPPSTPTGEPLFTTRSSIFVRGEGGFGGERGPSTRVEPPARDADLDTTYDVTPQQALLYRLCGDRNPLHADPAFAEKAGFPAPILHGLCSYGIVLREVVQGLLGSDATRRAASRARFAGIVFPGETIRVQAWDEGERVLVAATRRLGRRRRATAHRCSPTACSRAPEGQDHQADCFCSHTVSLSSARKHPTSSGQLLRNAETWAGPDLKPGPSGAATTVTSCWESPAQ